MHHNNINPIVLNCFKEEKKKKDEGNSDLVKAEGVCRPLRELGQNYGWVSPWVISLRRQFSTIRVIKSLMG
jgi:hypothetical protein